MFLVTGATGFIGSHLVEKLCAAGVPVRALMRRVDRDWPCPTALCDLVTGRGTRPVSIDAAHECAHRHAGCARFSTR